MSKKKITITQIKSAIGYPQRQKDTIKALGFRKLHQTIVHVETPAVRGMIKSVQHLLRVTP